MTSKMIIAGFGGQGVMMIGKLLCYSAMDHQQEALFFPQYGPEQRGGTANCSVILSDEPIGSPILTKIDVLIAMNAPSLLKFQDRVKEGGTIFINSTLIDPATVRKDVRCIALPVDDLAIELGSQKVANIIMLGAYVEVSGRFTQDEILETVQHKLGSKKQFAAMNHAAICLGMDKAAQLA